MEEKEIQIQKILETLPGLNCGGCGFKTCADLARVVADCPDEITRCINPGRRTATVQQQKAPEKSGAESCNTCSLATATQKSDWKDFLGREYDFVLQTFPNEPGPRETILPHNPSLTRELEIKKGDILIGRPLGMSCGCPITHCGVVMDVDTKTGVMVWCVTGPLQPRMKGFKDIGYYAAEAYEGIVKDTRKELKIGMRYWFLPRRCMLQWRHSGLINFVTKTNEGTQIRIEGLMIG
jgi:uncharacterized Fe-S cluster-containing protein